MMQVWRPDPGSHLSHSASLRPGLMCASGDVGRAAGDAVCSGMQRKVWAPPGKPCSWVQDWGWGGAPPHWASELPQAAMSPRAAGHPVCRQWRGSKGVLAVFTDTRATRVPQISHVPAPSGPSLLPCDDSSPPTQFMQSIWGSGASHMTQASPTRRCFGSSDAGGPGAWGLGRGWGCRQVFLPGTEVQVVHTDGPSCPHSPPRAPAHLRLPSSRAPAPAALPAHDFFAAF